MVEKPNLSELYHLCVLSCGDHPACEEFFRTLRPILGRIAGRIARQYDAVYETEDLVQEISLKLIASGRTIVAALPKEPEATVAYFSVLAANSARDFFRGRGATKRGTQVTVSLDTPYMDVSATLGAPGSIDRDLLMSEIEDCLPESRRDQVVFRLYYRQGFTAREIASIAGLQLTVKGVESMILRITRTVRKHFEGALNRPSAGGGISEAGSS